MFHLRKSENSLNVNVKAFRRYGIYILLDGERPRRKAGIEKRKRYITKRQQNITQKISFLLEVARVWSINMNDYFARVIILLQIQSLHKFNKSIIQISIRSKKTKTEKNF